MIGYGRTYIALFIVALVIFSGAIYLWQSEDTEADMYEFTVDDLTYRTTWDVNPSVEVKRCASSATAIDIPETVSYKGVEYTVTSIGSGAFANNTLLNTVTMPDTVQRIGFKSFSGCSELKNISLSSNLVSIPNLAFDRCVNLTSIEIPASVTSISTVAFQNCISLREINVDSDNQHYLSHEGILFNKDGTTLIRCPLAIDGMIAVPDGVTTIGSSSFSGCRQMERVVLPDSLTKIAYDAFINCITITSITIPRSVTSIDSGAFDGCTALSRFVVDTNNDSYTSIDGALYDKEIEDLIRCPEALEGVLVVPNTVMNILTSAIVNCDKLIGVRISDSVVYLGSYMFMGCTSLEYVYIGKNITDFPEDALNGCSKLREIVVSTENTAFTSHSGMLFNKMMTRLYKCPVTHSGAVILQPNVEWIGNGAFNGCANITEINIPEPITDIGNDTFNQCTNLKHVSMNNNIKHIGQSAFKSCVSLNGIDLPDGIRTIGDLAFYECASLTEIHMPESLTEIGKYAFFGCVGISALTISSGIKVIPPYTFASCISLNEIIIPEGIVEIGNMAFISCTGAVSAKIPASVTSIGSYSFSNNGLMRAIDVDENNTYFRSIDGVLFDRDVMLLVKFPQAKAGPYRIPDTVTRIGENAFTGSSEITEICFSGNLKLNGVIFIQCPKLKMIIAEEPNDEVTTLNGILYSNDMSKVLQCPSGKSGTITLSKEVKRICSSSFFESSADRIAFTGGDMVLCDIGSFQYCNPDVIFESGRDGYDLRIYTDQSMTTPLTTNVLFGHKSFTMYLEWTKIPIDHPSRDTDDTPMATYVAIILVSIISLAILYRVLYRRD